MLLDRHGHHMWPFGTSSLPTASEKAAGLRGLESLGFGGRVEGFLWPLRTLLLEPDSCVLSWLA